jgi:hypothetical protein
MNCQICHQKARFRCENLSCPARYCSLEHGRGHQCAIEIRLFGENGPDLSRDVAMSIIFGMFNPNRIVESLKQIQRARRISAMHRNFIDSIPLTFLKLFPARELDVYEKIAVTKFTRTSREREVWNYVLLNATTELDIDEIVADLEPKVYFRSNNVDGMVNTIEHGFFRILSKMPMTFTDHFQRGRRVWDPMRYAITWNRIEIVRFLMQFPFDRLDLVRYAAKHGTPEILKTLRDGWRVRDRELLVHTRRENLRFVLENYRWMFTDADLRAAVDFFNNPDYGDESINLLRQYLNEGEPGDKKPRFQN